nr:lipid-A-disaccharide synthase [Frigidibacter sp. ROC022]
MVAGEPSGDRLGAALMAGLRQLRPEVAFQGVGGAAMGAEGLESLFPMQELSVMGLSEVLPKYRALKARMVQTADAVIAARPDVLVGIDSPDFCLRVAARVRAAAPDIRIVHYVAPSVWAWRPGRAAKMARHVDQVLTLLPFEPPYMEAAGMRADFVGHPVVSDPLADRDQIAGFRAEEGLGEAPVLLVLPGSRRSEVTRLMPVFGAALRLILAARPGTRLVLPAAAPVAEAVIEAARGWPGRPLILDPRGQAPERAAARKRAAFGAANAALAASGTVSLELAAADTPMVIAYDLRWLSWQIMSRMARVPSVTLVNLVSGCRAVPELLGPACRPELIAQAVAALLGDGAAQAAQRQAMAETMQALGRGGEPPGLRAARAVLDGLAAG